MTTILRDEAGELAERIQQLKVGNKTKADELAVRMRADAALLATVRDSIEDMEDQHSRGIPTPAGFPFVWFLSRQAREINSAATLANRADDLRDQHAHLQVRLDRATTRLDRSQRALQNTKDRIKALNKMANPTRPGLLYWRHIVRKAATAPLLSTANAQLSWQKLLNSRLSSRVDSLEPEVQTSELDARQSSEALTDIKVGLQQSNERARQAWLAIQGIVDLPALSTAPVGTREADLHALIMNARAGNPTNYQELADLLRGSVPLVALSFQLQPANFWWATADATDTSQKRRILQQQVREVVRAAESLRMYNTSGIAAMNIDTAKKLAGERIKALLDENNERNTEVTAAQAIYHSPDWHRDVATEPGIMRFQHLGAGWFFGGPLPGFSGETIRIPYNINASGNTLYTLPNGTTTQDVASAIIETQRSTRRTELQALLASVTGATPPVLRIHNTIETLRRTDPRYAQYLFATTLNQTGTPPVTTGIKVTWTHAPLPIGTYTPPPSTGSFDVPLDTIPVRYLGTPMALSINEPVLKAELDTRMQTILEGHDHTLSVNTLLRPDLVTELSLEISPAVLTDFTGDIQVQNGTVTLDYTHTRLGSNAKQDIPAATFTTLPSGGFDPARIHTALSSVAAQMKKMHHRQAYIDAHSAAIQSTLLTETQDALSDYGVTATISYVNSTGTPPAPIVPAQYRIRSTSFAGVDMAKDFDLSHELLDITYDTTSGVGTSHTLHKLVAEAKKQIQGLDKEFKRVPAVLTRELLLLTPPVSIGNATCTLNKITNHYTLRVQDLQGKASEFVLNSTTLTKNIDFDLHPTSGKWVITIDPTVITELSQSATAMSTAPTTARDLETEMHDGTVPPTIPGHDVLNETDGRFRFVEATARKEAHYLWNVQTFRDIPVTGFELEIPFSALTDPSTPPNTDPNSPENIYAAITRSEVFKKTSTVIEQIASHNLLFTALEEEAAKNPRLQAAWTAQALRPTDIMYRRATNKVAIGKPGRVTLYSLQDYVEVSCTTRRRTKKTTVDLNLGLLPNIILNDL